MLWPDTIGFDHRGSIVYTSDMLQNFVNGDIDFDDDSIKYRIYSLYVGTNSYLDAIFSDNKGGFHKYEWEILY